MKSAKLYRYQLPMDSGVILRNHKLTERVGFIVELSENGRVGRSEISPLIGFSLETTDEAGLQAQQQLEMWINGESFVYDELYPSVAFGLSMAELELAGELPAEGNYRAAPLCSGDPDELIPVLSAMEGEKIAKVKVGLYEPIRDGMIVSLLLESIPDLSLRLDANRSWSLEQAQKFAKSVAPSLRQRIHYLEEPCMSPGDSFSLAIDTGIAIAWDETLQHAVQKSGFSLEDLTGAKAIVIKPMLIGSVQRCIDLIEKAKVLSIQTVISSSIESSLGLDQLARFSKWQLPNEVPGLDTLNMFQTQLETAWPESTLPVAKLSEQQLMWQS
ncbi:o-succinylbenzoate synthase [Vibrio amylolyticus]|uniref:o-succinylbenzoate synthase n=1 Tax=Vibrio amylolyticus TaxID=2847292 RepID=UPI003550D835